MVRNYRDVELSITQMISVTKSGDSVRIDAIVREDWRGSNRLLMELPEEDLEEANSMMMLRSNVGPACLQWLRHECKD